MSCKRSKRPVCNLFVFVLLFGISAIFGQNTAIDLSVQKQLIRGFGGMNHTGFPGDITANQADLAFGNGPGQLGFSILRIHVDPNSGLFNRELATAKKAKSYGALIFASPWSPPSNMKTNNNQVSGSLKVESYAAYAAHLKSFCDFMSNNGVPLYAISVQNEPDIKVTYESCDWTSAQMIDFLKNYRTAIGTTKVIAPESFQFKKPFSDAILNDGTAVTKVDIIGGHIYGGGLFDYPLARQKGKEVWMTEHYTTSDRSANLWPDALEVGKEIHDCMVANFNAYVWWYIRRSYGPIDDNSKVTKRGYVMGQFSKFVRPDFVRIDAPSSPSSNVYVTAFKSDTSIVVVIVNKNTSDKTQQLSIKNGTVTSFKKYTTSGTKNISDDGTVAVLNGSFSVSLDAQSITTLTGKATTVGVLDANSKNTFSNNVSITGKLNSDYSIYDLRGNLIRNSSISLNPLQIRNIKKGIYVIKSGNTVSKKFIKITNGQ